MFSFYFVENISPLTSIMIYIYVLYNSLYTLLCLVDQSCLTIYDPMDCSLPGSSVYGMLQGGYWSRLPFPPPGDLPDPGVEPKSPALQADSLPSELPGKPNSRWPETKPGRKVSPGPRSDGDALLSKKTRGSRSVRLISQTGNSTPI